MNTLPEWHYDESQHTGADFSNIEVVKAYDDRMQRMRDIPKEIETVRTSLELSEKHTLIDIGTGTGEFSVSLSKYCKEVIAVDISTTMLEYAKQKAASLERSNIQFIEGGFLTYEHQGEPADAVLTQFALHHLPDFWKTMALRRIHSMLKPGGKLFLKDVVFISGLDNYDPYFDGFINHLRQTAGEDMALASSKHIKNEYSTLDWIMEGIIRQAGFSLTEMDCKGGFIRSYLCEK